MYTYSRHNEQTLKYEKVKKNERKQQHNNKTAYMHTCTYMNSEANSERTLQSICNVILEKKNYITAAFRMTIF